MFTSSTLCRAQAAAQRERANGASLQNVRDRATAAAAAWDAQALLADIRELRKARSPLTTAQDAAMADALGADDDEDFGDEIFGQDDSDDDDLADGATPHSAPLAAPLSAKVDWDVTLSENPDRGLAAEQTLSAA